MLDVTQGHTFLTRLKLQCSVGMTDHVLARPDNVVLTEPGKSDSGMLESWGAAGGKGLEGWLWTRRVRWANTGVVKTLLNLSFPMTRSSQCFVP